LNACLTKNSKDSIPHGNNSDIGRRILRKEIPQSSPINNNSSNNNNNKITSGNDTILSSLDSSSTSSHNSSDWGHIGVVIEFVPMEEVYINSSNAVVEGEIGDEINELHKAGHTDTWKVLFGNGKLSLN
jgi:hypothetical protein